MTHQIIINDALNRLEQALQAPTLTQNDWKIMQNDTQTICLALPHLPADQAKPYAERLRDVISRLEVVEMDLTDQLNTLRGQ